MIVSHQGSRGLNFGEMLNMIEVKVPTSIGELIDKITILEIKTHKIIDPVRVGKAEHERMLLGEVYRAVIDPFSKTGLEVAVLADELHEVNLDLWDVEDNLRDLERAKDFGEAFIHSARSVYQLNDKRFALKDKINQLVGSDVQEVKSYSEY